MSTSAWRYLKPADVRRLGSYELAARVMVEGWLAGRHASRQRGASIEFHEYRAYSPGDDVKLIDWRVLARADKYVMKTFQQETNLECHLFVDSSASMGFPEGAEMTKLDYASFFAACLAWLVIRRTDRVSLTLFDREIRQAFPPGSSRTHLHQILQALEKNQPGQQTNLAESLARSLPLIRRRGTVVIVSDFYEDPSTLFHALNPWIHRGFRIHLFHVLTPGEWKLADDGLVRLEDAETGERLTVHSRSVQAAYQEAARLHTGRLRAMAAQRGVDYFMATTDTSYFNLLDHLTA
jgi:uncharacterized protein (DUF58 family)